MAASAPVRLGEFTFDAASRELRRGPETRHLSPKAFHLLSLLVDAAPRALSKEQLCESLWPDVFVEEANLKNLIAEVRAALEDNVRSPRFLRTIHRFGYALRLETGGGPPPAQREPAFRLVYLGEPRDLGAGVHVLGRDSGAAMRVNAPSVSRHHARVVVEGGRAFLEDLESKNGTFRNGVRVTGRVPLEDGDEIRLGSAPLTFRLGSATSTLTLGTR